jgi:hypothetical protein
LSETIVEIRVRNLPNGKAAAKRATVGSDGSRFRLCALVSICEVRKVGEGERFCWVLICSERDETENAEFLVLPEAVDASVGVQIVLRVPLRIKTIAVSAIVILLACRVENAASIDAKVDSEIKSAIIGGDVVNFTTHSGPELPSREMNNQGEDVVHFNPLFSPLRGVS